MQKDTLQITTCVTRDRKGEKDTTHFPRTIPLSLPLNIITNSCQRALLKAVIISWYRDLQTGETSRCVNIYNDPKRNSVKSEFLLVSGCLTFSHRKDNDIFLFVYLLYLLSSFCLYFCLSFYLILITLFAGTNPQPLLGSLIQGIFTEGQIIHAGPLCTCFSFNSCQSAEKRSFINQPRLDNLREKERQRDRREGARKS